MSVCLYFSFYFLGTLSWGGKNGSSNLILANINYCFCRRYRSVFNRPNCDNMMCQMAFENNHSSVFNLFEIMLHQIMCRKCKTAEGDYTVFWGGVFVRSSLYEYVTGLLNSLYLLVFFAVCCKGVCVSVARQKYGWERDNNVGAGYLQLSMANSLCFRLQCKTGIYLMITTRHERLLGHRATRSVGPKTQRLADRFVIANAYQFLF